MMILKNKEFISFGKFLLRGEPLPSNLRFLGSHVLPASYMEVVPTFNFSGSAMDINFEANPAFSYLKLLTIYSGYLVAINEKWQLQKSYDWSIPSQVYEQVRVKVMAELKSSLDAGNIKMLSHLELTLRTSKQIARHILNKKYEKAMQKKDSFLIEIMEETVGWRPQRNALWIVKLTPLIQYGFLKLDKIEQAAILDELGATVDQSYGALKKYFDRMNKRLKPSEAKLSYFQMFFLSRSNSKT